MARGNWIADIVWGNDDIKAGQTQLDVGELSRKLLLSDPKSAGLTMFHNKDAAYLPFAANDYFFASRVRLSRRPRGDYLPTAAALVSLQMRCAACHGNESLHVITFSVRQEDVNPPVKILKPAEHEHAVYVIARKKAGQDFGALQKDWKK